MSLIARHLEANGVPTVVLGCARDIVEHAGVPRFLWSDFPLGNSTGKPTDATSQRRTLNLALGLFEKADAPRYTVTSSQTWSEDLKWQLDFMNIDMLSNVQLEKLKAEFVEQKRVARATQT